MPFIGNQPALSYTSFAKQDFTTSATTSYTLDNPVTNANELALFINFVRQEPTTAYSASGTTLTLTSATSASDDMYCVYLGKAVQTVNPPNASVGASQIVDASITSGKLASGVLPTNTPAFQVVPTAEQSISADSYTKLTFGTENWDIGSCFDLTNSKFVVPTGKAGKYDFYGRYLIRSNDDKEYYISFYKNGAIVTNTEAKEVTGGGSGAAGAQTVATLDLNVGDEIECYVLHSSTGAKNTYVNYTVFGAYKIIE